MKTKIHLSGITRIGERVKKSCHTITGISRKPHHHSSDNLFYFEFLKSSTVIYVKSMVSLNLLKSINPLSSTHIFKDPLVA